MSSPRVDVPTFTVLGDPVPAPRPRVTRSGGVYSSSAYEAFRDTVGYSYRMAHGGGVKPTEQPFAVSLSFYLKTKRRRDLDNLAKGMLDALTGLVWVDDSQVCVLRLRKTFDAIDPRTVVRVRAIP